MALMILPVQVAIAADSLEFCLTISSWTQSAGLTRLASGSATVSTTSGDFSTASVDTAGHLTFQVPTDQAATWSIDAGVNGVRNFRSEVIDGLLYIYDTDVDDHPVDYTENGDGTYCIEYYCNYLYICGPADSNSPIMGRTFQPQYDIAQKKARAKSMPAQIPLYFERNQGQINEDYDFLARAGGLKIALSPDQAAFSLKGTVQEGHPKDRYQARQNILMKVRQADGTAKAIGEKKQPGRVNYFVGKKEDWKTNIPTFGRVRYEQIYPGIDLVYYGRGQALEYDFIVAPGVDPAQITLSFEGQTGLKIDESGNLILGSGTGRLVKKKPFIYQEIDGKQKQIEGNYRLLAKNSVGFELGEYDKSKPLIIDPTLVYSTYLGGSGDDYGYGIAVDSTGAVYVAGSTSSNDFPLQGASDGTLGGAQDVFVTKLNPSGSGLVYSTYLGGGNADIGHAIAVDSSGAAYVTGITKSNDFPLQGAYDGTLGGAQDVFVTKLNPSGSGLVYSTYLGGASGDSGNWIAVDSSGAAYVTGYAKSNDFPLQSAYDNTLGGFVDAFVTKFNPAGDALVYSTYLGGSGDDNGYAIAVDSSGAAYVTGFTRSADFPTQTPYDNALGGAQDAFVTKLDPAGDALLYSTYLGGSGSELGYDLAVDSSGAAYVTGYTYSADFPTQTPFDNALGGAQDAFVTKLGPTGNSLTFSTYLGGSGSESGYNLAVDSSGAAYVTGTTYSADFPTQTPYDNTLGGAQDAFVTKLNQAGNSLAFSTYLGGSGAENGLGIAVDSGGNIYVTGSVPTNDFPTTTGAYSQTFGGGSFDAFVTKFGEPAVGSGIPPGGPYGQWGGGREIQLTGFCGDISDLIAQCIASGGDCDLSFAWPFSFGSDPATTDLDPQNSAMPFFMLSWTYPDGTVEENRLAVGESVTLPSGAVCASSLGQDVGVQHVALKQTLPGSLTSGLASGTHTLAYWLMDTDGNCSNQRTQTLIVE